MVFKLVPSGVTAGAISQSKTTPKAKQPPKQPLLIPSPLRSAPGTPKFNVAEQGAKSARGCDKKMSTSRAHQLFPCTPAWTLGDAGGLSDTRRFAFASGLAFADAGDGLN